MKPAALALSALTVLLGGCSPFFFTVTEPPPAHQGRFAGDDEKGVEQIVVSKGVAIAIECREPWFGEPCAHATARSENPEIAVVLPTHLKEVPDPTSYRYADPMFRAERTGFVVAGVAKGETTITVSSTDGDQVFHVIVADR